MCRPAPAQLARPCTISKTCDSKRHCRNSTAEPGLPAARNPLPPLGYVAAAQSALALPRLPLAMSAPTIVIIARSDHAPTLQKRLGSETIVAVFPDSESLRA